MPQAPGPVRLTRSGGSAPDARTPYGADPHAVRRGAAGRQHAEL
ncbi:hypothetical protein [Streptomyces sp. SUK 48]|nr:hypothetical protein [Streptomyces sp. SUK 48]